MLPCMSALAYNLQVRLMHLCIWLFHNLRAYGGLLQNYKQMNMICLERPAKVGDATSIGLKCSVAGQKIITGTPDTNLPRQIFIVNKIPILRNTFQIPFLQLSYNFLKSKLNGNGFLTLSYNCLLCYSPAIIIRLCLFNLFTATL